MTPFSKELVFDLDDMHIASVCCPKCGTGFTFDVAESNMGVLRACPICKEDMQLAGELLDQYRKFYHRLRDAKLRFNFRVPMPSGEAKPQ